MGYLLTEIVVYLVIAGLIGFAFGWAVKAGALDKYFDKFTAVLKKAKEALKAYYLTLTTSKKVVKETADEVKETVVPKESAVEVASAKVAEVLNEEIKETKESVKEVTEVVKKEVIEDVKRAEPVQEEVQEETITEVKKELEVEVSTPEETVEKIEDVAKPTLLTEVPAEGQDKLSSLKGLGPVMEKKLNELGVYTFEQMASWNSEEELWIGTQLSSPQKVINAEWVKQAKELVKAK